MAMVEITEMKILNGQNLSAFSENPRISNFDLFSNVISIFSRIFAVLFNLNLAFEYYKTNDLFYFRMTLCFIFIPAFVSIIVNIAL